MNTVKEKMNTVKEKKVLHQPLSLGECCSHIIANHISLPGIEDNYKTLIKDYPKIVARMALQRAKMTPFEYITYAATMAPYSLDYPGERWFSMFDHYNGKKSTMDIMTSLYPRYGHITPEVLYQINYEWCRSKIRRCIYAYKYDYDSSQYLDSSSKRALRLSM